MNILLSTAFILCFAGLCLAQTTVSVLGVGSPPTGVETRQGYIGVGAEVQTKLFGNLSTLQRFSFNREHKRYSPEDLDGHSSRYTGLLRLGVAGKGKLRAFVIPFAANLRRVKYAGEYGYSKNGFNFGLGGGISYAINPRATIDGSIVYYFPDLATWDVVNGKRVGNASRGWSMESNGYFTTTEQSKWQVGYLFQLNAFKSIHPYDPEPRPFYGSTSVVMGLRFGRKFQTK